MKDFINLGAIGFAQLGTDDYYLKKEIETKVLKKFLETDVFNIPEPFKNVCSFGIKSFPYEGDSYREVVLYYKQNIIDEWEEDYNTTFYELGIDEYETLKTIINKADEFWDFANKCEDIDFESDELMKKCVKLFAKEHPMHVVHKKQNKKKDNNDDENLQAV